LVEVRESNREAEELLLGEIAADAAAVASLEAVRET
jgi:hypothetical protein